MVERIGRLPAGSAGRPVMAVRRGRPVMIGTILETGGRFGVRLGQVWEDTQRVLRDSATWAADGRLVAITRRDGGCDYGSPGVYRVKFKTGTYGVRALTIEFENADRV